MTKNLGVLDRVVRFTIGIMVLGLYGALPVPERYLTLLGLIPLGTALTGTCPIYASLGVSTLRRKQPPA